MDVPVAQKVETWLVDDLDGSVAAETVRFSLDGREFEIDLSRDNAGRLRDALARYVGAARRAGTGRRPIVPTVGRRAPMDRDRAAEVREWARGEGFKVSDKGRIASDILEAYDRRGSQVSAAAAPVAEENRRSVADPFTVQAAS